MHEELNEEDLIEWAIIEKQIAHAKKVNPSLKHYYANKTTKEGKDEVESLPRTKEEQEAALARFSYLVDKAREISKRGRL